MVATSCVELPKLEREGFIPHAHPISGAREARAARGRVLEAQLCPRSGSLGPSEVSVCPDSSENRRRGHYSWGLSRVPSSLQEQTFGLRQDILQPTSLLK